MERSDVPCNPNPAQRHGKLSQLLHLWNIEDMLQTLSPLCE